MNFHIPHWRSSRELQNVQHVAGSFYQIGLTVMGIAFGKDYYWTGVCLGAFCYISARLSVELQYRVQKALIRERHDET